eukprot:TRINITY_DN34022_c0_g1_i1.p1 TRINITY_DN34022_c0_g1~~TRINITY_DN34022_c0_g1_i1.p1  ORF type:complete len:278 (-),score=44.10 TRINITY_DN34022_c0_g1_i1:202-1035(-)
MQMSRPSPCCPPGAEPLLEGITYQPRGQMVDLGEKECYVARPTTGDCSLGILLFHDGLGFPAGRCKEICDDLASAGYLVIMPHWHDGFLGKGLPEFECTCAGYMKAICNIPYLLCCGGLKKFGEATKWDTKIKPYIFDSVLPWLESQGVKKTAAIGFCWGTYQVFRCAQHPDKFACGVDFHMSVDSCCKTQKENDMDMCRAVRCPQLIVACKGDAKSYFPGGDAANAVLQAAPGSKVLETEQKHGFFNRGDPSIPEKRAAILKFHAEMMDFLKTHLG